MVGICLLYLLMFVFTMGLIIAIETVTKKKT